MCLVCQKEGDELEQCLYPVFDYDLGMLTVQGGMCKKQLYHRNMKNIAKLLGTTRIGKRFANRKFENFIVNDKNHKAYEKCNQYCDSFSLKDGQGLLLIGDYGTGKTHLAVAILQNLLEKGIPGLFVTVPEMLAEIRKTFDNEDIKNDFLNSIKSAEFLVLDDLGTEKSSEWVKEQLFMIINARYEGLLSTVITTNFLPKELDDKVGARTISRLIEMCDGIMLNGEDYRKQKLK